MSHDVQLEMGSATEAPDVSVSSSRSETNNVASRSRSDTSNVASRFESAPLLSSLSGRASRKALHNVSCTNILLGTLIAVQVVAYSYSGTPAFLRWLKVGVDRPAAGTSVADCRDESSQNANSSSGGQAAGVQPAQWEDPADTELDCTEIFRAAIRRSPYGQAFKDVLTMVTHQLTERAQQRHHLQPLAHALTSAEVIRERLEAYGSCPQNVPDVPAVAVCSLQHSTGLYVQEWVAHYLLLGVSKVFIYDNSQPGTAAYDLFREAVAPFVESAHVAVTDWHFQGGFPRNLHMSFDDCRNRHKSEFDWIAFLDADEFVVIHPPAAPCLPLYLKGFKDYPGLAVQWRVMTPLGVARHDPGRLFLEQYHWEVRDRNSANMGLVKTIAQPKLATVTLSPHHQAYVDGRQAVSWNRDMVPGALMGREYPDPYKEIEVRHFWAGDWETGFLEKVCSPVLERVQLRNERARILLEWMDTACCQNLTAPIREEVMLRRFMYGPPAEATHP